jgi:hypothetical protein
MELEQDAWKGVASKMATEHALINLLLGVFTTNHRNKLRDIGLGENTNALV